MAKQLANPDNRKLFSSMKKLQGNREKERWRENLQIKIKIKAINQSQYISLFGSWTKEINFLKSYDTIGNLNTAWKSYASK